MSDMTDLKMQTKTELNDSGMYQITRHRIASQMPGGPDMAMGSTPSIGIIGTSSITSTTLPTVVEEPELQYGRRRTSSLVGALETTHLAHPPFPMGTMGLPFPMGGVGQVPPFSAATNPYFGLNPASVSHGLAGPAQMPPPFPPGVNYPYPGYPSVTQQLPPGNFNPATLQTPLGGTSTSYRVSGPAPDNGRNRLQLFDSLQDASTRGPVAIQSSATDVLSKPPGELTTVMLRNVPNGYTRTMLLELIDSMGFQGRYDFVYLPMDFRNGVNLGYAFVNSITHEDAMRLTDKLQGFSLWSQDSSKVCEVSWAHPNQGLAEHVERYRNSPVMHPTMPDDYKPMVFRNGTRIPFPQPTKAIKAPKLRLTPNPKAAA